MPGPVHSLKGSNHYTSNMEWMELNENTNSYLKVGFSKCNENTVIGECILEKWGAVKYSLNNNSPQMGMSATLVCADEIQLFEYFTFINSSGPNNI